MHSEFYLSSSNPLAKAAKKIYAPATGTVTHPLTLSGPVNPLTRATLVSQHITLPYVIHQITVHFPPGADHLVRAYLFLSLDPSAPTTELPPGTSLLSPFSSLPYLTGDDQTLTIPTALIVRPRGTWLKLHLVNTDASPHTITSLWTITEYLQE